MRNIWLGIIAAVLFRCAATAIAMVLKQEGLSMLKEWLTRLRSLIAAKPHFEVDEAQISLGKTR